MLISGEESPLVTQTTAKESVFEFGFDTTNPSLLLTEFVTDSSVQVEVENVTVFDSLTLFMIVAA